MTTPPPPIAIFGTLHDIHAKAVHDELLERGHKPVVIDTQLFPEQLHIALGEHGEDIVIDGQRMPKPAAVYIRGTYHSPAAYGVDADAEMKADWRRTLAAYRESTTLVSSIIQRWALAGTAFYNPPAASANIIKPYQLALLKHHGLPVPKTIWTNDPQAVRCFFDTHTEAIFKPVVGGAATRRLTAQDLTDDRLATLAGAPVAFQELLPGEDIRVYIVDGKIVSTMRIVTDAIDFREDEQAIESIELPLEVQRICIKAAEVLGLRFTGMDLKADKHGVQKILELNPSPMFLGFEQRAGVDITGPLCDALLSHLS